MGWMSIESAPRDGTPIAYLWRDSVVSTCLWLADPLEPCWWDVRCEEPAAPLFWMLIDRPAARGVTRRGTKGAGRR